MYLGLPLGMEMSRGNLNLGIIGPHEIWWKLLSHSYFKYIYRSSLKGSINWCYLNKKNVVCTDLEGRSLLISVLLCVKKCIWKGYWVLTHQGSTPDSVEIKYVDSMNLLTVHRDHGICLVFLFHNFHRSNFCRFLESI